jgi:pimeloyl-ACP methyl ester carboxylesterase
MTVCDGFLALDAHLGWVVRAWLAAHEAGGPGLRFDIATPWVWGQAFLSEHADGVAAWRAAALAGDATRARNLIAGMAAYGGDAGPALDALDCPVLALVGEDDVMTPPRHARAIAERAGDGRLALVPEPATPPPSSAPPPWRDELLAFWHEIARRGPTHGRGEEGAHPMTTEPLALRHVDVDDRAIAYHEAGDGYPVCWCTATSPASAGTARSWRPRQPARAGGARPPQLRRQRPARRAITMAAYADAVRSFARALELHAPVLVGHSLGGNVAMRAVGDAPRAFAGAAADRQPVRPTGSTRPRRTTRCSRPSAATERCSPRRSHR